MEPGQLLGFELFALVVNAACIGLVLLASGRIGSGTAKRIGRWLMWLLVVLFILNTVGNPLATSWFERIMARSRCCSPCSASTAGHGPDSHRHPPRDRDGGKGRDHARTPFTNRYTQRTAHPPR